MGYLFFSLFFSREKKKERKELYTHLIHLILLKTPLEVGSFIKTTHKPFFGNMATRTPTQQEQAHGRHIADR